MVMLEYQFYLWNVLSFVVIKDLCIMLFVLLKFLFVIDCLFHVYVCARYYALHSLRLIIILLLPLCAAPDAYQMALCNCSFHSKLTVPCVLGL